MTFDELKRTFATRLAMARAQKDKMSQEQLAGLIGVKRQSIQLWENPNLRDLPKIERILDIANKLGVSFSFLFGDKIKETPAPKDEIELIRERRLLDLQIKAQKEKIYQDRLQHAINKSMVLYGHPNNAYRLMQYDNDKYDK